MKNRVTMRLIGALAVTWLLGDRSLPAAETVLDFSHATARVEMNKSFPGLTNLTLSLWVRTAALPGDYASIAGRGHLQGANGFGLFSASDGTLSFQTRTGGTVVQATTAYSFDNQWRHLTGVRDGDDTILYIDGEEAARSTGPLTSLDSTHQFGLGARDAESWGFYFNGAMADVRLWNHARSQADIQADRFRRLTGDEAGLLGYWPLDEGEGSTAADATVNTNHGVLVDAVWVNDTDLTLWAFVVAHPVTGSRRYTNTRTVDAVKFPYYEGYDVYQVTEGAAAPDPDAWISTNPAPATVTFALPATDTSVVLTAWFTNLTASVPLVGVSDEIIYTTAKPQPVVHPVVNEILVEGQTTVVLSFADIDNGSSGGTYNDDPIPFTYALRCSADVTPEAPYLTLDTAGQHNIVLYLTNAAGNTAKAYSQARITSRTQNALYVALDGSHTDGLSWATAYTSPATALARAVAGDVIFIKGDDYLIDQEWVINANPDLMIRGGYVGSGTPGATGAVATVVRRDPAVAWTRLVSIHASTVHVERIEFRNGRLPRDSNRLGAGLYITGSSAVTIDACIIAGCSLAALSSSTSRGSGLYIENGTLNLVNSRLDANSMDGGSWAYENSTGAGLAAVNSDVVISNVVFINNINRFNNGPGRGGGVYLLNGQAAVYDSDFTGNQVRSTRWHNQHHMGGGLYAQNVNPLTIRRCRFTGNQVRSEQNPAEPRNGGDAIHLQGPSLVAYVSDSMMVSNGLATPNQVANAVVITDRARATLERIQIIDNYGHGVEVGRAHANTAAGLTNILVAGHPGHGVVGFNGTVILRNVTLADNDGWGITNSVATLTLRSAIVWDNAQGSIAGTVNAAYSCVAGGHAGDGNIDADPLFAAAANRDYHLTSRIGRWDPAVSVWVVDPIPSSPCIRAGDPADERWQVEPEPNGGRINMGAYGGTVFASKAVPFGTLVQVR